MHSDARPQNVAVLLAQIGSEVSRQFGARVLPLGITASDASCLRIIASAGPLNQRHLARRLGIAPSRVVTLIDALEGRGHVERRVGRTDRRNRELALTGAGEVLVAELRALAHEHARDSVRGLGEDEVGQLARLLRLLADAHGLPPGARPWAGGPDGPERPERPPAVPA